MNKWMNDRYNNTYSSRKKRHCCLQNILQDLCCVYYTNTSWTLHMSNIYLYVFTSVWWGRVTETGREAMGRGDIRSVVVHWRAVTSLLGWWMWSVSTCILCSRPPSADTSCTLGDCPSMMSPACSSKHYTPSDAQSYLCHTKHCSQTRLGKQNVYTEAEVTSNRSVICTWTQTVFTVSDFHPRAWVGVIHNLTGPYYSNIHSQLHRWA